MAKELDEEYCRSCGKVVKKEAVLCVHCGVRLKDDTPHDPKDKTTAILLAVFLGFWTWLYTYRNDSWKFWLNLILTIITFFLWGIVSWIWAIIDTAIKPDEYYKNY